LSTSRFFGKIVPIPSQRRFQSMDVRNATGHNFSSLQEISAIETTHRINDQIRLSPIRVVDQDGKMLGVIPTSEALRTAADAGLDLVEVAPNERPPVCRIMDYGKFKYEQKRKAANSAKQHQVQLKEIRLRPKTGEHDIDFKVKQAREFLVHKDKVKFNVQFKGRENAHHDRGREMLASIIEQLQDISKVEKTPSMEGGRNMTAVLSPKA
jgi:translation initiation factor IF-3